MKHQVVVNKPVALIGRPAVNLTAADVNLISITQNGSDVVVDFTVSLPDGGIAVPATAVVMALDTSSVKQDFQDIGLSLGQVSITNPTTSQPTTPSDSDSALTTAGIIGVVVGAVGGVILILIVILYCRCTCNTVCLVCNCSLQYLFSA